MKIPRILMLLLVLGQILVSAYGDFQGEGPYADAIITPAGYAFSIWGLIILGSLSYSIYQLLPSQKKIKLFDELNPSLSVTFSGYIFWIYAASQNWLWSSVGIFILMLAGLWNAYIILKNHKKKLTSFESILYYGTLGTYIGWSSAAIPLNISASLVYYNFIYPDARSVAAYFLILVGALAHALYGQWRIGSNYYYTATIIWAFAAIVVGTLESGSDILALISLMAIMIFAAIVYVSQSFLAEN